MVATLLSLAKLLISSVRGCNITYLLIQVSHLLQYKVRSAVCLLFNLLTSCSSSTTRLLHRDVLLRLLILRPQQQRYHVTNMYKHQLEGLPGKRFLIISSCYRKEH